MTAEITILRYCVIHDWGDDNPLIVEGRCTAASRRASVARSTNGWPTTSRGQLLTAPFMDPPRPMPPRSRMSRPTTSETPSPLNPLGIKVLARLVHPGVGRHRLRDRGRRGLPDPVHADQPERALGAAPSARHEGSVMKISGPTRSSPGRPGLGRAARSAGARPLHPRARVPHADRPAQPIVRVTAGVAAIKGTYDGSVALVDLEEPHALTMKARGAGGTGHDRGHRGGGSRRRRTGHRAVV